MWGVVLLLAHCLSLAVCWALHNLIKRNLTYEQRVCEVERDLLPPCIFTYKRLASLFATKKDEQYNAVIVLIRYRLSFSLLRSAIMCIQRSRSAAGCPWRYFSYQWGPALIDCTTLVLEVIKEIKTAKCLWMFYSYSNHSNSNSYNKQNSFRMILTLSTKTHNHIVYVSIYK